MDSVFTIGRLAREAGVPASTVRYYERCGLLRPSGRTEGNFRLYDTSALERLRFIRSAQLNGFTLDDVATLLQLREATGRVCKKRVREIIRDRLADLEGRVEELSRLRSALQSLLDACLESGEQGECPVIAALAASTDHTPSGPE